MVRAVETKEMGDRVIDKLDRPRWSKFEAALLVLAHGRLGTGNFLPDLGLGEVRLPRKDDLVEIASRFRTWLPIYHEGHNSTRVFNDNPHDVVGRKKRARDLVFNSAIELCALSSEFQKGEIRKPTFCQLAATIFLKSASDGSSTLQFRDAMHYINSVSKNSTPYERARLPWRGASSQFFESIDTLSNDESFFSGTANVFITSPGRMLTTTEILLALNDKINSGPRDRIKLGIVLEVQEILGLINPQPWHVVSAIPGQRNLGSKPLDVYASSLAPVLKPEHLNNSPLEIMRTLEASEHPLPLSLLRQMHADNAEGLHRVPMVRRTSLRLLLDALVKAGLVDFIGSSDKLAKGRHFFLTEKGKELIDVWNDTEVGTPLPREEYEELRIGILDLWGKCHG